MQHVSSSLGTIVARPGTRLAPPIELVPGDLTFFVGKQTEHSALQRRVIYQVTSIEAHDGTLTRNLTLQPVFDFENPIGTELKTVTWCSESLLKKLNLLDIATLRLYLDNFLRAYAKRVGEPEQSD
jgi:hypothetical protein